MPKNRQIFNLFRTQHECTIKHANHIVGSKQKKIREKLLGKIENSFNARYDGSQLFTELLITSSILPFTVFCSTSLFIISCHGNDPFL